MRTSNSSQQPAGKKSTADATPSLRQLRRSLTGSRFESLKATIFAAFLLGLVGLAIHELHLANPGNQFAANTTAALKTLADAVTTQITMVRIKTTAIAAAIRKSRALPRHLGAAISLQRKTAQVDSLMVKHLGHAARAQSTSRATHSSYAKMAAKAYAKIAAMAAGLQETARNKMPSFSRNLLTPDSLAAGIAGLLLYVLFVRILVRKRGGLRAFGGSQAA